MANLYFVRHGEASSSWETSSDPGLSDLGWRQAEEVANEIDLQIKPVAIYSSPLLRAKHTASPLEKKWNRQADIIPAISEIPSGNISMDERRNWLNQLMTGQWKEQPDHLMSWRSGILDVLNSQTEDAVFFTHFMVLNVIVGAISGASGIVSFRPDNCAVTKVDVTNGIARLVNKGDEAHTIVS
ncbi:hypothetical protein A9Q83_05210 [Alphaproteobacteria bacterium 46_93_T64]|nr:hypothetical protein A9Q83_05210 [Alphaproteobacteria bacterium 46_93_T64]